MASFNQQLLWRDLISCTMLMYCYSTKHFIQYRVFHMESHKIKGVLWLQIFSGKIMYSGIFWFPKKKKISFQRPPVKLRHLFCLKVWKLHVHPKMRSTLLKIQKNNLLQISKRTYTLTQHISWGEKCFYTKHPFTFEGFHIHMEYPVY